MGGRARSAGSAVHRGWGGVARGEGEGGWVHGVAGVHHVRDGWVVLQRRGTGGAGRGLIRLGEGMSMGGSRAAAQRHGHAPVDTDDRGREGFGAGSETGFVGFFCRTALDGTLEGFGCGALDFALRTDDAIRRDSGSRGLSLGMRRPYAVGGDDKSASMHSVSGGDSNSNIIE